MRSNNVLKNLDTGQSRFELCHQAFSAMRKQLNDDSRARRASSEIPRTADAERHEVPPNPEDVSGAPVELSEQPSAIAPPDAPPPVPAEVALAANDLNPVEARFRVLSSEEF